MRSRFLSFFLILGLLMVNVSLYAASKQKKLGEDSDTSKKGAKAGAEGDAATKDKDNKGKDAEKSSGVNALPEWATDGTSVFSSVPADILPNKKYMIYLVGDLQDMKYENYKGIVNKFVEGGFIIIANPVQNNAYNQSYVDAIAGEVKSLLHGGVPASNITVLGFSHGGIAALKVSSLLQNPEVNYIIVGGCPKPQTPDAFTEANQIIPVGRFLNIYDKEDTNFGRFMPIFKNVKGTAPRVVQEKAVKTGKGHKFGLEPIDAWINPAIQFAK